MRFHIPRTVIEDFCRRWQVAEMSLFGPVLRDDFAADSDVDVMVVFAPQARHGAFELSAMRHELEAIFRRPVDLVERRLVEESDNYIRRRHILESAQVIYGSRPGVPA